MKKIIFIYCAFLTASFTPVMALPPMSMPMIELEGMEETNQVIQENWLNQSKSASSLKKVNFGSIDVDIPEGSLEDFVLTIDRQIARCSELSQTTTWSLPGRTVKRKEWCGDTLKKLKQIVEASSNWKDVWQELPKYFDWYQSKGNDGVGEVLFTGYYLPSLEGSRTPTERFYYPLYMKPSDLVQVRINGQKVWRRKKPNGSYVPYYNRKEIDYQDALVGKGLELFYVDDYIKSFFLHIQGSGRIVVHNEDGSTESLYVTYAGQNGRPYTAIGKILKDEGKDERYYKSMQGLLSYFEEFPLETDRIFPMNESYVFFGENEFGVRGAGSTYLVPKHSIAVDYRIFPMGAFGLLNTKLPLFDEDHNVTDWRSFSRLALAQDTGGAIRGAGRVDTYWGAGEEAELIAGHMAQTGTLYFAVIKK